MDSNYSLDTYNSPELTGIDRKLITVTNRDSTIHQDTQSNNIKTIICSKPVIGD